MPFNGSGGTTQPAGSIYPATANTLIESAKANTSIADIYTMLASCIVKDGQTTTTQRIPFAAGASMGSQTITALADGTATTHAATVGQVRSGAPTLLGTVAGTNTITAILSPALTAYASGQKFVLVPANTNTGATTINIDSVGAKNIFANGAASVGGELVAGVPVEIEYDGTQFNILGQSVKQQATATVAAHATTSNVWVAREVVLSGGAVTFTAIPNAPYAGAVVWVKQNAAHVWTDGATFNVQGNTNYTAAADDWIRIYATTVSTFEVTIFKASGAAVTGGASASTQNQIDTGTDLTTFISPGRNRISLGTEVASTSGTSIDFTGIPAGTRRIIINGVGVSTNGTSPFLIQLGDAGGIENTGYKAAVNVLGGATTQGTTGFLVMEANVAANAYDFKMVLDLENAATFMWVGASWCQDNAAAPQGMRLTGGTKALSAELTQVRITTSGGVNTFDLGVINIQFER